VASVGGGGSAVGFGFPPGGGLGSGGVHCVEVVIEIAYEAELVRLAFGKEVIRLSIVTAHRQRRERLFVELNGRNPWTKEEQQMMTAKLERKIDWQLNKQDIPY